MTREAVDELDLKPGDLATAAVKSTNVIVEIPDAMTTRRRTPTPPGGHRRAR